jgi:hypothetical protein
MKKVAVVVLLMSLLFFVEPALAGPGGKIVSAAFETFWGRIALGGLVILFSPLIAYVLITEKLAERRTMKDLRFMAGYSVAFDWLKIRERAKDCFLRVHAGWENEDLADASAWMTDWYWQNQQLAHLNRWKRDGLRNVCEVKKVKSLKPLLFVHRNQYAQHGDSMIVVSIQSEMKDYLENRASGKLVEGSKRFKDVETLWTFTLQDGVWRVSDIEQGNMSFAFAKLSRKLPNIETTLVSQLRA